MPLRSPSQSSVTESVPSCQSFLANTKQRLYNTLKENRIIGASNSIKKKNLTTRGQVPEENMETTWHEKETYNVTDKNKVIY
jgi:hypothetical protein